MLCTPAQDTLMAFSNHMAESNYLLPHKVHLICIEPSGAARAALICVAKTVHYISYT